MEKYNLNELSFPCEKKLLRKFSMIYNFAIANIRIHFAIYDVRSDNSNPADSSIVPQNLIPNPKSCHQIGDYVIVK